MSGWRKAAVFLKEWLLAFAFAVLVTQFGASAVVVDGVSMSPNLRGGELLLVPKPEAWLHRAGVGKYARGDIVVFKPPRGAEYERTDVYRGVHLPWSYRPYLIKRVAAVEGDRVQMMAGQLYVNGVPVAEPNVVGYWKAHCHDTLSPLANTPEMTVPAGHYYVLGDNRSLGGSVDSRMFGPVPVADIAGRAAASVWPIAVPERPEAHCNSAGVGGEVEAVGGLEFNLRLLGGE